jgi:hypothetical protein
VVRQLHDGGSPAGREFSSFPISAATEINELQLNAVHLHTELQETVRITVNVLGDVLGARLSADAKAAWGKALTYAFSFMGTDKAAASSGTSVLSAGELAAARSAWNLMKDNVKVAERTLVK